MSEISILITTYNRKDDLKFTLNSLQVLIEEGICVMICDDGSTDGTSELIRIKFPNIKLLVNSNNKGLIYSRNLLMRQVQTPYAISLDDDANFLSAAPLKTIREYFEREPGCGVIAFRLYWGIEKPKNLKSEEKSEIVKSYVGCGHAWRMKAWHDIPEYPAWYRFYGEENFASLQLLKKKWEVHYLPAVLVQHRVDNTVRKKDEDYYQRARRSLRADWYNYVIFYPIIKIIRTLLYSIKMQILKAINKRDITVIRNLLLALGDVFFNLRRLIKNRKSLTNAEYRKWKKLPDTKIYWNPDSFLIQNNKEL